MTSSMNSTNEGKTSFLNAARSFVVLTIVDMDSLARRKLGDFAGSGDVVWVCGKDPESLSVIKVSTS